MRRRYFLRAGLATSLTAVVAGCADSSGDGTDTSTPTDTGTETATENGTETDTPEEPTNEEETETEEEPDVDRPANYRWDLTPGRNEGLRNDLGQYVSGSVDGLVEDHPVFGYSTDSERDDHTVDFEALKLFRDSNFDIMVADPNYDSPMEDFVAAFVDDSMYENAKTSEFIQNDADALGSYSSDAWLNADTVEDSLDLGHNLLVTLSYTEGQFSPKEQAATIREAYKQHHDFDVLAWAVPMERGSLQTGMMYSPNDDKVRTFNTGGEWSGGGEAQTHAEIQDWRVINNPENFNEGSGDPTNLQHPVLFHTDERDRQGIGFEEAKDRAVGMVYQIATDDFNNYNIDAVGDEGTPATNVTMTTGATEQLTRTLLDYNKSGVDADFEDIWNLASFAVGKYLEDTELNGVIDTVERGEDYEEYFGGGFAFYEVEDEEIVDEVKADRAGEYDNFGQVYDELEAV